MWAAGQQTIKKSAISSALFFESNFLDYFTNLKDSSEPSIDTFAI